MSRLTGWRRRLPVRVGVVSAVSLGAGAVLLLVAGVIAVIEGRLVVGFAAAGGAAVAAALGLEARRMMSRISYLATLEEVDRFALHAIAGDVSQQARRLERLAGTSERGVRAGLAVRLIHSAAHPDTQVDPSLLAGILALAPQQIVLVTDAGGEDAYTRALAELSPTTVILRLPDEQHIGAFFDRLAARRRTSGAPVPVLAATSSAALRMAVRGPAAEHLFERFGVEEFLVLAPPGSRAALDKLPHNPFARTSALGTLGLLVTRTSGDAAHA